jgi:peptidoglycan/xylan/chitin deacetylase (PgdA/CDA1 family)
VKWTDEDPLLSGSMKVAGEEAGENYVSFTFDDGPSEKTTAAVLDALAKYDIPATFFIVTRRLGGKVGQPRKELLLRILAEGHVIGSHTVSHPNLRELEKAAVEKEIDGSLKQLVRAASIPIGLFRPPFGALGANGAVQIKKRRLTEVLWSLDSYDFRTPNPKKLRARVGKMIGDGGRGVILFHDTKQSTARAMEHILDDFEAMNCGRLAAGQEPVLPVSIHYYLRDKGKPRPVPDEVAARTARYKGGLPARCAARPAPPADTDTKPNDSKHIKADPGPASPP